MSTFEELKRRNVFRVGAAYLVMGWLLIEVSSVLLPTFGAPEWVMKVFSLLVILGLPIALFLAWAFEMTPEGVKREAEVDRSQSITSKTGRKLDFTVIGLLLIALVYFVWERQGTPVDSEMGSEQILQTKSDLSPVLVPAEPATDDRISIAVLPFVNMSDDPANEYFSDGIAEELLNSLVKLKGLRVASRTSSFFFKGKDVPLGQIGADLEVAHVLEGSVRKAGNQVRITAQLIDVATDSHLWSETYDRELEDIFAIQSEISGNIAAALQIALGTAPSQSPKRPTGSLAAYDAYLQGRHFMAQRGTANLKRATREFSTAIELDPEFAQAHGALAKALSLYAAYSWEAISLEYADLADKAIAKALELEPGQLDALVAKAYVAYWLRMDWTTANETLGQLLREHPEDAEVHNFAGDFYLLTGDFARAETAERRALELDPLAEVHARDLAYLFMTMGQYDKAVKFAQRAYELRPDLLDALQVLAQTHTLAGNTERALQLLAMIDNHPDADAVFKLGVRVQFYSDTQDLGQLKAQFEQFEIYMKEGKISKAFGAYVLVKTDQMDPALEWLELAYEENDPWLIDPRAMYLPEQYSSDPRWLAFWQQPRLAEMIELRRLNIERGNGSTSSIKALFPEIDRY